MCPSAFVKWAGNKEKFVDYIVTGGVPLPYHFCPETKKRSFERRHSTSPKPRKFKEIPCAGKAVMNPPGQTINSDRH